MASTVNAAESTGLAALQFAFAARIRDPDGHPLPDGVDARRMAVYGELFHNNVEDALANAFPVLRGITEEDRWHALVRDFFARHRCRSPLFHEVPREFVQYLENERPADAGDPPFLPELAHYEWVELALAVAEDPADRGDVNPSGNFLEGVPVLSPLAWPLSYRFPVHRIGPEFRPGEACEPTHLLVYRGEDDQVGFLELNTVTARLLTLVTEGNDRSGLELLTAIATEIGHPHPPAVIEGGLGIMEELRGRGVLLGTRAPGGQ